MGKIDDVTKEYVRHNEIFADIFNYFLYNGEQIIKPEYLKECDITQIALPYGNREKDSVQKYRDVLKALQIMEDENGIYVLLGAELQTKIHYAMPARNMLYDAINYVGQINLAAKNHPIRKRKGITSDEFLSNFSKKDKILPVITLVVYFGSKKWDGPIRLHDMFNGTNDTLLKFVPDYVINLISPDSMSEEDFNKFHTEFRKVMKFIKFSSNKDALQNMLDSDKSFETVSRETANVINVITNSGFSISEKEEVINMCKAIKEIREEERAEGRLEILIGLVKDKLLTISDAASRANMSVEDFEKAAGLNAL